MTFLLLLLTISMSSILIENKKYTIFKPDNSPVLIFNNEDLFIKIKILKMVLFDENREFYRKYILQYIDNSNLINIDKKSYYSYEPVKYSISEIKSDNTLFLYVIKVFEFLEYMVNEYYIIPFLTDYNTYVTRNGIKILLIDYIELKNQSIFAEYYINKFIEWLKSLMKKLEPRRCIRENYNDFLKRKKYIMLEKIDILRDSNRPLNKNLN